MVYRFGEKIENLLHFTESGMLQNSNGDYHIVSDGILTKKDFSILFENQEKKMHIPIEVANTILIYSDIMLSSNFLNFASSKKLKLQFYDSYGEYVGAFIPSRQRRSVKATLLQSNIYLIEQKRLTLQKKIISSATRNIKSNVQYYRRRYAKIELDEKVQKIASCIKLMKEAESVNQLMLIEARMREVYYSCFDMIIMADGFVFQKRTRRPPRNEINAMISFGNTILYNYIASKILNTELDIRISFLHASNHREQSLNLDLAELFKPVIVDRIIFYLINKHIIISTKHFVHHNDGSVLFNQDGKQIFLHTFKNRLQQSITAKGERMTYDKLLTKEIAKLKDHILYDTKYIPFRYE